VAAHEFLLSFKCITKSARLFIGYHSKICFYDPMVHPGLLQMPALASGKKSLVCVCAFKSAHLLNRPKLWAVVLYIYNSRRAALVFTAGYPIMENSLFLDSLSASILNILHTVPMAGKAPHC
jgi:hypothetical protein